MESLQGKHFSITDPKNVNTVIYQVNKTEKDEVLNGAPKFTIERLEYSEELRENASRKTFFVDEPKEEGNHLVILSFAENRVVVNMGILQDDKLKISKKEANNALIKYGLKTRKQVKAETQQERTSGHKHLSLVA